MLRDVHFAAGEDREHLERKVVSEEPVSTVDRKSEHGCVVSRA